MPVLRPKLLVIESHNNFRAARSYIAIVVFLVGCAILIAGVTSYYLVPAMEAAHSKGVTTVEKRSLMAYSGLILTFRIGRFFFPRKTGPRVQTKYVDAWQEAGKRMETPKD